jgi:hypothetical protein
MCKRRGRPKGISKEKKAKCSYIYCKNENDIDRLSDVRYGTKSYHKDCFKNFHNLKKIRELAFSIDKTLVMKNFNNFLYELVFIRMIEVDYILFVLDHIIENEIEVNMPYGLLYRLNNYKIKELYNNQEQNTSVKIHSS